LDAETRVVPGELDLAPYPVGGVLHPGEVHRYILPVSPYRTTENRIEGVVAIFIDINRFKELESSIRQARAYAEEVMAVIHEPLLVLDAELRIISANRSFYAAFGVTPGEAEGTRIYALQDRQWDIPRLHSLFEEALSGQGVIEGFLVEHDFPGVGHRVMRFGARTLHSEAGPDRALLAIEIVTDRSV
ncbi:MAG: PAS domain-containing protein, partial [Methanomicrobiales archaeon]|nr:PAS domain-containing protein [Methanomicrobiales archaeon]